MRRISAEVIGERVRIGRSDRRGSLRLRIVTTQASGYHEFFNRLHEWRLV